MAKPSKTSKFFKTLLTVLLLAIIVITVAINVAFYKTSSAPFNSVYIMQQTDMNDVQYGDAVIASPSKVSEVKAGNVVLCLTSFDNEFKEVLKVIDVTQEDGTTYYYVRSDEQSNDEALRLTQDKILAKCLWTNSSLGAIINFAKSNMGIIVLIGIPCVILLILKISSAVAEQKEAKKEEELRKKAKKKAKKNKALAENANESTEPKTTSDTNANKPKPQNTTKIDADEFFSKSTSKSIPVKQLSEEESVQQRENVSKTKTNAPLTKEITREFKNGEVVVSPNHVNALKIEDEPNVIMDEDVHSPNMNEKAIQIRKNLSNLDGDMTQPTTPTPVVVPVIAEKPVEVAQEPIQEVVPDSVTPETQETTIPTSDSLENAVVIIPETPKADTTPTIAETTTNDDDLFKSLTDDDLLNDIIGDSNEKSSGTSVSDDFLDQLLDSIPSSHATETVSKTPTTKATTKTTERKTTTKKAVKHHKVVNKAVDDTSFDELIKAIDREKNGIK